MASLVVEGDVDAPLPDVWALVADFVGFITAQGGQATGEGEGIGMTRTVMMGSDPVVERLEDLDEAGHSMSYSLLSSPLPVTDYLATIKLTAEDEGVTHVHWSSRFEPVGISEEDAGAILGRIYGGGIKSMKRYFAATRNP